MSVLFNLTPYLVFAEGGGGQPQCTATTAPPMVRYLVCELASLIYSRYFLYGEKSTTNRSGSATLFTIH